MHSRGRPLLYRPEFAAQAHQHCLMGATNADLADIFGVTSRTIVNWMTEFPDFAAAVRDGRVVADGRVARGLYERAIGCERTSRQTTLSNGVEKTIIREVHYPPDTRACIFWLRNRQPQSWGDRKPDTAASSLDLAIAALDAANESAEYEEVRRDLAAE